MGGIASQFLFTGVVARLDRNVGKVGKGLNVLNVGNGGKLGGNVTVGRGNVVVIVGILVVVTGARVVAGVVVVGNTIVGAAVEKVNPDGTVIYGKGVVRCFL